MSLEDRFRGRDGYGQFRTVLGLVLLVASGLKAYQLFTEPLVFAETGANRILWIGLIEFELVLGIWLLCGLYSHLTWYITLFVFALFSIISFEKIMAGEASCGCFGMVKVNPWYSFIFDVGAVSAHFVVMRPQRVTLAPAPFSRTFGGRHILLFFGLLASALLLTFSSQNEGTYLLPRTEGSLAAGSVVVLKPEEWIGKRFPLTKFFADSSRLETGKSIVILHRNGCQRCRSLLQKTVSMFDKGWSQDSPQLVLIEIPTHNHDNIHSRHQQFPAFIVTRKLDARFHWFCKTPTLLTLVDGVVTSEINEEMFFRFLTRIVHRRVCGVRPPALWCVPQANCCKIECFAKVERLPYVTHGQTTACCTHPTIAVHNPG